MYYVLLRVCLHGPIWSGILTYAFHKQRGLVPDSLLISCSFQFVVVGSSQILQTSHWPCNLNAVNSHEMSARKTKKKKIKESAVNSTLSKYIFWKSFIKKNFVFTYPDHNSLQKTNWCNLTKKDFLWHILSMFITYKRGEGIKIIVSNDQYLAIIVSGFFVNFEQFSCKFIFNDVSKQRKNITTLWNKHRRVFVGSKIFYYDKYSRLPKCCLLIEASDKKLHV